MTIKTDEFRTTLIDNLVSPAELAQQIPLDDSTANFIIQSRKDIEAIIKGDDKRAYSLLSDLAQFMILTRQSIMQKN
jgi:phospho-2-dehydro-3-deoxyheptonate aldolase